MLLISFIIQEADLHDGYSITFMTDNTKSIAAEADAILCSMDDKALYGEEIYRIGFGEAVEGNC